MVFLCKRCGRVLTSAKSIKLGYGPTCYRIVKFHDNPINIEEEIKFLKLEINMLKRVIRELKPNKIISYQATPIIKIRNEERNVETDINKGQMKEVIQELKNFFQSCNGDVKSLFSEGVLKPNFQIPDRPSKLSMHSDLRNTSIMKNVSIELSISFLITGKFESPLVRAILELDLYFWKSNIRSFVITYFITFTRSPFMQERKMIFDFNLRLSFWNPR